MQLSYINPKVREYCYSKNPDLSNNRFSISEIQTIRSYIADLRSAPNLSEIPLSYNKDYDGNNMYICIEFENIKIISEVLTSIKNPIAKEIRRLKILDIIRTDLHLLDTKAN